MATAPKPFYYQLDGTIIGPVTGIDLRDAALARNVAPSTLVANDPDGEWVAAIRIRGLFDERGKPLPHPPETIRTLDGSQEAPRVESPPEPNHAANSDRTRHSSTHIESNVMKTTSRSAAETRQEIANFVVEHADELPHIQGVNEFVEEHGRLSKELAEAKQWQQRMAKAKQEYEPLEQRVDKCHRTLKDAQTELAKLYRPLGEAAFKAFLASDIDEQPIFAERLAVHKQVQVLRQESDGLTPGSDAGFVQQAKAKAQQLAIIGKIKLEELKFGGLHTKIGSEIVESELDESIRCDATAQLLSQLKHQLGGIARCSAELEELTESKNRLSKTHGNNSLAPTFDHRIIYCLHCKKQITVDSVRPSDDSAITTVDPYPPPKSADGSIHSELSGATPTVSDTGVEHELIGCGIVATLIIALLAAVIYAPVPTILSCTFLLFAIWLVVRFIADNRGLVRNVSSTRIAGALSKTVLAWLGFPSPSSLRLESS